MAKGKGGTKAARRLVEAWGQGRIDYFDAFQRMADLAVEEADLLLELVGDFTGAAALEERLPDAHAIGAACDAVVDEVVQCADGDFVTPVARDEIVELAMAINEVTDEVERVAKHFHMYDISSAEPAAVDMCRLLRDECAVVQEAMEPFRDFKKPKKLMRFATRIDELEDEMDLIYHDAVRALFAEGGDPLHVVKWHSLYSAIEECSDSVDRVADLMARIVVNNN